MVIPSIPQFFVGDYVLCDGFYAFVEKVYDCNEMDNNKVPASANVYQSSINTAAIAAHSAPPFGTVSKQQKTGSGKVVNSNKRKSERLDSDSEDDYTLADRVEQTGESTADGVEPYYLKPDECLIYWLNIPPKFGEMRKSTVCLSVVKSSSLQLLDRSILRNHTVFPNPYAFPHMAGKLDDICGIVLWTRGVFNLMEKNQLLNYILFNTIPDRPDFLPGITSEQLEPMTVFHVDSSVRVKNHIGRIIDIQVRVHARNLDDKKEEQVFELWLEETEYNDISAGHYLKLHGKNWLSMGFEYLNLKVDWLYCVNGKEVVSIVPKQIIPASEAKPNVTSRQFMGAGDCVRLISDKDGKDKEKEYIIIDSRTNIDLLLQSGERRDNVPSVNLIRSFHDTELRYFIGDIIASDKTRFMITEIDMKAKDAMIVKLDRRNRSRVPLNSLTKYGLLYRIQDEILFRELEKDESGISREIITYGTICNVNNESMKLEIECADYRKVWIYGKDIVYVFDWS